MIQEDYMFAIDFRFLYDFNNTHYALFVSQLKLIEKYDTLTQYSYQLVTNKILLKCIPALKEVIQLE